MLKTSRTDLKPLFTEETAVAKVQVIQNLWNSGDARVIVAMFDGAAKLFNSGNLIEDHSSIQSFLELRLSRELHCAMTMDLWSFSGSRISASFVSEWQDAIRGQWYRTEGNMQMCFSEEGLIEKLSVSAFDAQIHADERSIGPGRQGDWMKENHSDG